MNSADPLPAQPAHEDGLRLILITDTENRGWAATSHAVRAVCSLARAGSVLVLLREPNTDAKELVVQAQQVRRWTREHGQRLSIKERLDIALWVEADGVHLGEQSVAGCELRAALLTREPMHSDFILSRAWHDIESPCDPDVGLLLVAPVAAPRKGRSALGFEGLTHAVHNARGRRVYALGGIGPAEVSRVMQSGAAGSAVIGSAYADPTSLVTAMRLLRS